MGDYAAYSGGAEKATVRHFSLFVGDKRSRVSQATDSSTVAPNLVSGALPFGWFPE